MPLPETFIALVAAETADKTFTRTIQSRRIADLPGGEVLVKVQYSSLNYKDMLSATGNRGVTRSYPHTPGIDAAGVVAESADPAFRPGDPVIVTSYDLGMNTAGGFGRYIRVPADWVVPMPDGMTARDAMVYGTAGFTAGLSVRRLLDGGIRPGDGEILVSGATGGVGGLALAILAKIGYAVTAVNGRTDAADYLKSLGACAVISREEAVDDGKRPLLKTRWAGVVDNVGGAVLAAAVKSAKPGATVTCCGNSAGADLPLTVFPFILRGITLAGIDSQNCPMPVRRQVWGLLASDWKLDGTDRMITEVTLPELDARIDLMRDGRHRGRTIVRLAE